MTTMVQKTACRHLETCPQKILAESYRFYCLGKAPNMDQDSCSRNNDIENEDKTVGGQGPFKTPKEWKNAGA